MENRRLCSCPDFCIPDASRQPYLVPKPAGYTVYAWPKKPWLAHHETSLLCARSRLCGSVSATAPNHMRRPEVELLLLWHVCVCVESCKHWQHHESCHSLVPADISGLGHQEFLQSCLEPYMYPAVEMKSDDVLREFYTVLLKGKTTECAWSMPVASVLWKAKAERSHIPTQPSSLRRTCFKVKNNKMWAT